MAGNYDVTHVTVRNGVDNTSSFTTVNGKKQFIGTPWNQTSHITNDANEGTIFEDGQGMTLKLNSRYKNGGADVFSNLDRKHTGISFDLLDKFIEAAGNGVLEDLDHKGYTPEDMQNFGKAFDTLRQQKLAEAKKDPYSKEYTKMMNGTQFSFTASELETLYKAAGFGLVKKQQEVKPQAEVKPQPETKPQAEAKPQEDVTPQAEGDDFTVGTDDDVQSKAMEATVNKIIGLLGVDNKDDVHIDFEGTEQIGANGEYTEVRFTYEGQQYVYQNGEVKAVEEAKENVNENVGQPTIEIDGKTYYRRYNEKTGQLEIKRKDGLFRKWHPYEEPQKVARAAAKRNASVSAATVQEQAPVVNAEQEKLNQYYQDRVVNAKFWNGRINVEADTQDPNQFTGSYDQVETVDGRRLARVSNYNKETHKNEFKYYEVKAATIHSQYGQNRSYNQIIPDLTREVTDAQF